MAPLQSSVMNKKRKKNHFDLSEKTKVQGQGPTTSMVLKHGSHWIKVPQNRFFTAQSLEKYDQIAEVCTVTTTQPTFFTTNLCSTTSNIKQLHSSRANRPLEITSLIPAALTVRALNKIPCHRLHSSYRPLPYNARHPKMIRPIAMKV